mmetsp:Transcript_41687/g.124527  ORF Transcript_41687/g.124527 Transcript_41687/m.124527 type:complete len:633 (+) Transcript_41687:1-1899(+)
MPRSARQAVPFLPGYPQPDALKPHNLKGQTLAFGAGGATDKLKPMDALRYSSQVPKLDLAVLETLKDPFHRYNQSGRTVTHDERRELSESARNTYAPANPPSWLRHDRQVLRFDAYFKESVTECPKENFRVRKCVVYYHLEDGTMMITEPKEENSGMLQGTLVKRHRLPRPQESGGGFFTHEDLKCGSSIDVYGRVYRLTDCDDFTRAFYQEASGHGQGSEEVPLDSFRASKQAPEANGLSAARRREIAEGREYNELFLGGNHKNKRLEQFLRNDRKVLSFKCFWDDPSHYGARLYYNMHYYLADDTVEIHENLARNSGRDPFPVFWRRSPLKKNPIANIAPGMREPDPIICKPEDFIVGEFFEVYNRRIYIYDCDEFTRDFYRQYLSIEQDGQEVRQPPVVHAKLHPPPHTGFGSEEDTMASVKHLVPRPPRRDLNKLLAESDVVLRFEARMANRQKEDENRRFVVAVYPADDSVAVWEARQRNSGHTEGRFARRSKKRNPATGAWFRLSDFQVGTTVVINSMPFHLVRADEATARYLQGRGGVGYSYHTDPGYRAHFASHDEVGSVYGSDVGDAISVGEGEVVYSGATYPGLSQAGPRMGGIITSASPRMASPGSIYSGSGEAVSVDGGH